MNHMIKITTHIIINILQQPKGVSQIGSRQDGWLIINND